MSNKQVSSPTTQAPPSLPDLNAQTYPFDVVLHLLDQSAYFNLIASPDSENTKDSNSDFNIRSSLHVFESSAQPLTMESGMKVRQIFGEAVGTFRSRWLPIANDFVAGPGREPPTIAWDHSRSQRFAMQEGTFSFGDGEDGFRGFGTGRTFPTVINSQSQLLAGAIGTTLEGFGRVGGYGGILEGTGAFEGIRGMLSVNSAIGIAPHALSLMHIFRIIDPDGKYSAAVDGRGH